MKEETKDQAISQEEHAEEDQKQLYSPPRLIVHGTVEKLTETLGTKGTDGPMGSTLV